MKLFFQSFHIKVLIFLLFPLNKWLTITFAITTLISCRNFDSFKFVSDRIYQQKHRSEERHKCSKEGFFPNYVRMKTKKML